MKKSNKTIFGICIFVSIMIISNLFVSATGTVYNWYCVHRKDHKQPTADSSMRFIEEYSGYYIDKKHDDICNEKVVYLTFDAGYENGNIARVLDVLKRENVCGAFFVLGNLIDKNPELIKRMFNEGHTVCNHTYSHKPMIGMSKDEFGKELNRIEDFCLKKTGYKMSKFYRPPEGKFDANSIKYADELGYKTIFWSFAYADWDNNKQMSPESAKKKILDNVHNGEIMLLHPTSQTNADILQDVIITLKNDGYRFGTLNELCGADFKCKE